MSVPEWINNFNDAIESILLVKDGSRVIYGNHAAAETFGHERATLQDLDLNRLIISDGSFLTSTTDSNNIRVKGLRSNSDAFSVVLRATRIDESLHLLFIHDLSQQENTKKTIDLLARVSEELSMTLDYEVIRSKLVKLPIPLIADWSVLLSVGESSVGYLRSWHKDHKKNQKIYEYFQNHASTFCRHYNIDRSMLSGEPALTSVSTNTLCPGEVLCLPLKERSEVVGLLCLGADAPRRFLPADVITAEDLARRAETALANARLYQRAVYVENQLIEAKKMAESANAAKTVFLASMSHEIRTPLSAILGFSDLLLSQGFQTQEQVDWAERIRHNGTHLLRLIDDILSVAKIESGKVDLEPQRISFKVLLRELTDYYSLKAATKGIGLKLSFISPIPDRFESDPTRLHQILSNLIGNAVKFTEAGQVEITLRYEANAKYLIIGIRDTGPGLTPSQGERLFQPFVQADISHTRRFGGSGLGLMVARQLARLMGGDVELASTELGKGSCFQVALPIQPETNTKFLTSYDDLIPIPIKPSEFSEESRPLKDMRILLVDDSPDNLVLVSRILRQADATVETASSGQEALEKAGRSKYTVILMDIQMPEINGIEATCRLRERGDKTPIIALTAYALEEDIERFRLAGCDGHLTKPIDRDRLIGALTSLMKQNYKTLPGSALSRPTFAHLATRHP